MQTRRFSNHESRLLSRSHTFAIIVILDLKIHQSMWIHWPFFPKTWTKGRWPLDDLCPHVCWGHSDSTQGLLCPSPMTIHQCMWIQWSILQNTTYIYILHTYYVHTTYRMSDHIVSYWTQFRRDKNEIGSSCSEKYEKKRPVLTQYHYSIIIIIIIFENFILFNQVLSFTLTFFSLTQPCHSKWGHWLSTYLLSCN